MASLKLLLQRVAARSPVLAYWLVVVLFVLTCAQFYIPGKGFTYLVSFGSLDSARYLPVLRQTNHYEAEKSTGYDGVYYAQIAMRPKLGDKELGVAVDNLPYRARRILFPFAAYVLAGGDSVRALHIYAAENIVCWLALAFVLLKWFPATSWGNFWRWFGVLGSYGLCYSVRASLLDGPCLLLTAIAMALTERGRNWTAALVMGLSGLGKETNIMTAVALPWPRDLSPREWLRFAGRGVLVVAPLGAWIFLLWLWFGRGGETGARNFSWPFVAYFEKCVQTWQGVRREGLQSAQGGSLFMVVALTTQWLFLVLRPRWRDPWWRLGASYAVLMTVIGQAVWEGEPGAASRVLLPMGLVLNVLIPLRESGRWWLVLILGNLTLLSGPDALDPPGEPRVRGPHALLVADRTGDSVAPHFDAKEWFLPEHSRTDYWRWSRGSASLVLHNPWNFPLVADLHFALQSNDARRVVVQRDGQILWQGDLDRTPRDVVLKAVVLPPGDSTWRMETDLPPKMPENGDPRDLGFCLRDLLIEVKERAP